MGSDQSQQHYQIDSTSLWVKNVMLLHLLERGGGWKKCHFNNSGRMNTFLLFPLSIVSSQKRRRE